MMQLRPMTRPYSINSFVSIARPVSRTDGRAAQDMPDPSTTEGYILGDINDGL